MRLDARSSSSVQISLPSLLIANFYGWILAKTLVRRASLAHILILPVSKSAILSYHAILRFNTSSILHLKIRQISRLLDVALLIPECLERSSPAISVGFEVTAACSHSSPTTSEYTNIRRKQTLPRQSPLFSFTTTRSKLRRPHTTFGLKRHNGRAVSSTQLRLREERDAKYCHWISSALSPAHSMERSTFFFAIFGLVAFLWVLFCSR